MSNNSKIFLAAVAGAALGAIGGILLAPASGKETIEDLSEKADELKDELEEFASRSRKSVQEVSEKLVSNVQTAINKEMEAIKDKK